MLFVALHLYHASHCGMIGNNCVALHLYLGLHPTGPTGGYGLFFLQGCFNFELR